MLIADFDEGRRRGLAKIVKARGFRSTIAADLETAKSKIASRQFAAVITIQNYTRPTGIGDFEGGYDNGGLELIKEIRDQKGAKRSVPVILILDNPLLLGPEDLELLDQMKVHKTDLPIRPEVVRAILPRAPSHRLAKRAP